MRNATRDLRTSRLDEGFTLIELLIVIVVLGILSGIVVLGVGQFRTDATTAACKATVDTVQVAVDAYEAQNGAGTATKANIAGYLKTGTTLPGTLTVAASKASDTACA